MASESHARAKHAMREEADACTLLDTAGAADAQGGAPQRSAPQRSATQRSATQRSATQRWHTFLSCIEVHTHLQAAALRLYPGRKLLVPERSAHQTKGIRAIATHGAAESLKFDVAQVWNLHSPSSYVTPYGFRRALTGENQDSPTSELDVRKYPSLEILKYWESERQSKFKYRAIMNAEDLLKFMLSDFARKGQYDEIFDGPDSDAHIADSTDRQTAPVKLEPPAAPPAAPPASVFSNTCLARLCEVERHFEALAELEGPQGCPVGERDRAKRRRLLGAATMKSMSRILFDASRVVLDTVRADGCL